jgi:hypothetical protein
MLWPAIRVSVVSVFVLVISSRAFAVPLCSDTVNVKTFSPCEIVANATTTGVGNFYIHFSSVTAVFTHTSGRSHSISGFYNGATQFRFRFTPTLSGNWTYSLSSVPADGGLTLTSSFFVNNDPTARGFLRRDPSFPNTVIWDNNVDNDVSKQHPFLWGQTYYQIISNDSDPASGDSWRTAISQSLSKGLTRFRILLYPWWGGACQPPSATCHYGYADTQPFLLTASQPEKPNHNRLNLVHWRNLDAVIEELARQQAIVEIILFHDQALRTPDETNNVVSRAFGTVVTRNGNVYTYTDTTADERYAKYAVARYGAFPNVYFCLSNEWRATHLDAAFWRQIGRAVRSADPYFRDQATGRFRLLSIHDNNARTFATFIQPSDLAANGGWVTHVVQQYSFRNDEGNLVPDSWTNDGIVANLPLNMPVFNDEFGYIAEEKTNPPVFGPFRDPEHRTAMWGIAIAGGYGTVGDITRGGPTGAGVTLTADWIDAPEYTAVTRLVDFFTTRVTDRYRLRRMDPALIVRDATPGTRVYVAAEPNVQYVFYKATSGEFYADLPTGRTWTIYRFNPRNGAFVQVRQSLAGGRTQIATTAETTDWAYIAR